MQLDIFERLSMEFIETKYNMWMEERLFEKTVYMTKGGKDMMIEKLP